MEVISEIKNSFFYKNNLTEQKISKQQGSTVKVNDSSEIVPKGEVFRSYFSGILTIVWKWLCMNRLCLCATSTQVMDMKFNSWPPANIYVNPCSRSTIQN